MTRRYAGIAILTAMFLMPQVGSALVPSGMISPVSLIITEQPKTPFRPMLEPHSSLDLLMQESAECGQITGLPDIPNGNMNVALKAIMDHDFCTQPNNALPDTGRSVAPKL